MRNMKKLVAWILGLVMLLSLGAAAGEALPEIPSFESTLNVRPVETAEEAVEYAKEFWALDFVGMDATNASFEVMAWQDDCWLVSGYIEGFGSMDVAFDRDGNVIFMENIGSGWTDAEGYFFGSDEAEDEYDEGDEADGEPAPEEPDPLEDAAVAWREMLDRKVEYPFLSEVNPAVYDEYTALYPLEEENNEYLTHYYDTITAGDATYDLNYSEYYRNEDFRIKFAVQTRPVLRIVFFDVYCDAEEGGNG